MADDIVEKVYLAFNMPIGRLPNDVWAVRATIRKPGVRAKSYAYLFTRKSDANRQFKRLLDLEIEVSLHRSHLEWLRWDDPD